MEWGERERCVMYIKYSEHTRHKAQAKTFGISLSLKKREDEKKANKINTFGGLLLTDTIAWREIMTCKTLNDSFYYPIIPSLMTSVFEPSTYMCVVWWQSHNIFIPKKIVKQFLCVSMAFVSTFVDSIHDDICDDAFRSMRDILLTLGGGELRALAVKTENLWMKLTYRHHVPTMRERWASWEKFNSI